MERDSGPLLPFPDLTPNRVTGTGRAQQEQDAMVAYLGEAAQDSPFLLARDKIKKTLLQTADGADQGVESRLDLQR